MKMIARIAIASAVLALAPLAWAADPSLHEVYQAVHDGRVAEAQTMMTQVLRDNPDSAKAHYVEAEVLARLGRQEDARSELARAETLAPGLPFAKPEAVEGLRAVIAGRHVGAIEPRSEGNGIPWGPIVIIGGIILLLVLFLRSRRAMMAPGATPGPLSAPYGAPYGSPYGGAPVGGGGLGSSIVGGLATGAALGAGMVAGEALAHDFMGSRGQDRAGSDGIVDTSAADDGGRDFGVSDSGSWDSGSGSDFGAGGGGGDWG